jgi:hypothetical protein
MTNKRRYILTAASLTMGMILSVGLIFFKKRTFDRESLLYLGTVFAYSVLIVIGIGWYLQRKSNKKDNQ